MMDSSARYVEVCDLPYYSEPDLFYQQRMEAGLRVKELRESACRLFCKQNDQLTVQDLKLAFLKMHPVKLNLGENDQEATVKNLNVLLGVMYCSGSGNCNKVFSLPLFSHGWLRELHFST